MMVKLPFLRTAYNYDRDAASNETSLLCEDPSLAQQHMKDESDINTIVTRFGLGYKAPVGLRMPQFGDFTGIGDYQEALVALQRAQDDFMKLPASVRSTFGNDPGAFVDFAADPANLPRFAEMGLTVPPPVPPVDLKAAIRDGMAEALNAAPAPAMKAGKAA